jgi:predicted Zn-ribbon and HTH transcriptional regulator
MALFCKNCGYKFERETAENKPCPNCKTEEKREGRKVNMKASIKAESKIFR